MDSGYFILLRYFLRIDNVIFRIQDTRIYHNFDSNLIFLENRHTYSLKMPKYAFSPLKMPKYEWGSSKSEF